LPRPDGRSFDGHILLGERTWPSDDRFHVCDVDSSRHLPYLRADRLDTATPAQLREQDGHIGWLTAHVNNRWGAPYVGQVVASWQSADTASIPFLQVLARTPITGIVGLVALPAHDVIGFRPIAAGVCGLDTSFLGADHEQAQRLLRTGQDGATPMDHSPEPDKVRGRMTALCAVSHRGVARQVRRSVLCDGRRIMPASRMTFRGGRPSIGSRRR
jgi:hypothetical protein